MEKGTAARQAVVAECGFNRLLRRHRELWEGYRIENLSKHTYAVRSPGSERRRTVKLSKHGWSCKCPYATFRKFHCKHIRAVEALCLLPDPEQRAPTVLDPIPENTCPSCGADGATKAGVRKNKNYRNQIYKCRGCKKRFSANSGFERLCGPPTIVCRAIDDFFCGKSTGKIARGLEDEMEHAPKQQTVSNWIRRYSAALGFFTSTLKPRLGDKCRSDGMHVKVRGRQRYMHMTIDSFTRLWTAYTITPNKATDDISCQKLKMFPLAGTARIRPRRRARNDMPPACATSRRERRKRTGSECKHRAARANSARRAAAALNSLTLARRPAAAYPPPSR